MYTDDDTMTPKDRISDEMLRRMLSACEHVPCDECSQERESESPCRMGRESRESVRPLASVYAPIQEFRELYDQEKAFRHGTMFAELDFPFLGASVAEKGGCRRD